MTSKRASSSAYTFKILDRQLKDLRRIKTQDGTAVAEQLRRAVDLWIAKQGKVA